MMSTIYKEVFKFEGKGIISDERAAQSLLDLQNPKKKSTTIQYIFQRRTLVTQDASTRPSTQPQDDTSANVVLDTLSPTDAKTGADTKKSTNKGQAGLERVLMEEDQAGSNPRQSYVVQTGPNLEPMHQDFFATVDPQVSESLKLTIEEHVHIENPPSSSGTLSSIKNLDDAFTFGDQFLNEKPSEEEPSTANVETKVESIVTVPIHQASSIVPPLSTPIIDLTPPNLVSPPIQAPTIIATTATTITTTLPLPPPLQQQRTTDPELANHNHDLYSKIIKYVNDVVKEAVHNAHQAPIRERFRDLSEFEMKEILHDRMVETGSYRSPSDHAALYEALELSMDYENREEFIEEMAKSCKRRRDDQDPPPPPLKDSDQSKNKRYDLDASASKQSPVQKSSAWNTSNTREAPSNSSKQNLLPYQNSLLMTYQYQMMCISQTQKISIGKSKLVKADLEGPAHKLVKPFHKNSISLQFQMEECHLLLTDQINLMNPKGDKERRNALSVSKLKAAYYLNFGLEELVPSLWIESEHDYDISVAYGYTYLKEIVLRKADYKEYKISEAYFKNLHLNDFEDLYMLHLQGKLNHLSGADKVDLFNAVNLWTRNIIIRQREEDLQLEIKSYQTKLNLTQPRWDETDFLFKEDYTIFYKPRDVIYRRLKYENLYFNKGRKCD
ncbi:hypothetical protein Tco_0522958 [Tanacetum coccineum]